MAYRTIRETFWKKRYVNFSRRPTRSVRIEIFSRPKQRCYLLDLSVICHLSEIPTYFYGNIASIFIENAPPTWHPPTMIMASHHCPPRFRHAETTVNGTVMGYRNVLFAKIGHQQPPQPANTGTARRRRAVSLNS